MMISRNSEITRPHQTLDAEGVDNPVKLRQQIAIGKGLARQPWRMSPFDRDVRILRIGQKLLNRRLQLVGQGGAVHAHTNVVDDELNARELTHIVGESLMLAAGINHYR